MKQSLQLKLGQQLSMTPQLQQAIKLLQMSTLDLEQEIQQVLDSNIMLEVDEGDGQMDLKDPPESEAVVPDEVTSEGSQTDIPDELPIDTTWDDIYENVQISNVNQTEMPEYEIQRSKVQTLHDHLLWQLEVEIFSERDHAIAIAIIDSINEDGYLVSNLDEIYQGLLSQLEELELNEVEAVLHHIQNFDPSGVAARDLGNCLELQLRHLPDTTPHRDIALVLVTRYIDLLAAQDQTRIMRRMRIDKQRLSSVMALIRTLDPKPGKKFQEFNSEYVVPDVFVTRVKGVWQVNLNPDLAPRLKVNPFYSGLIKRADKSQDNTAMKDHLQEARWFIKSLHSRNDTLLRVARCVVEKQTEFFEHGPVAMKAMVLRNVAEELDLHESTISRVTTQKYMHTPNGVYEFKYFFSSHVSTVEGGECSATAIRAFILGLIENEEPEKPLSDNKITGLFKEKGINVARRTIAKYREAMNIPSSSQRKRII